MDPLNQIPAQIPETFEETGKLMVRKCRQFNGRNKDIFPEFHSFNFNLLNASVQVDNVQGGEEKSQT